MLQTKKKVLLFALLLFSVNISHAVNITGCGSLLSGDSYTLNVSITGNISGGSCIDIPPVAGNSTISCAGYNVTGNETPISQNGIYINAANVTVLDCRVSNYAYGIVSTNARTNHTIRNTTAFNNTIAGFSITGTPSGGGATFKTIHNNTIYNNTDGIQILSGNAINITGNFIHNNTLCGISALRNSSNMTITNNSLFNQTGADACHILFDRGGFGGSGGKINISNNSFVTSYGNAIWLANDSANISIFNNTIINASNGIFIPIGSNIHIEGNNISKANFSAIEFQNVNNSAIYGNTINESEFGILVNLGINISAINNTVFNNTDTGIFFNNTNYSIISASTIYNNSYGIQFFGTTQNNITNTIILNSSTTSIYVNNSRLINATGNTINLSSQTGTGRGIDLESTNQSLFVNNTLYNHSIGIFAHISSFNNSFINNSIAYATDTGFKLDGASNINITNNSIFNNSQGVNVNASGISSSNFLNFSRNLVYFNRDYGMIFAVLGNRIANNSIIFDNNFYNNSYGLFLSSFASNNNISNNNFENNSQANIVLNQSATLNTFINNTIWRGNVYGVLIENASGNNFTGNTMRGNRDGFGLNNSDDNDIRNNSNFNNSIYGFHFWGGSDRNNITSNEVYTNVQGNMVINNSASNRIRSNTIYNGTMGIFLFRSSDTNMTLNFAYNHTTYGFRINESERIFMSENNASNNSWAQYQFVNSTANLTNVNRALLTPRDGIDINSTRYSNITSRDGSTYYNFTTTYGSFFFDSAINVSILALNYTDASATLGICGIASTFEACNLITNDYNVLNITNTSGNAYISLGMFYNASSPTLTNIQLAQYNDGWVEQGVTTDSANSIRLDGITSLNIWGVVSFTASSPSIGTASSGPTPDLSNIVNETIVEEEPITEPSTYVNGWLLLLALILFFVALKRSIE